MTSTGPQFGRRSVWFYCRSSLAVIAAVAVSTAVLSGALLVGSSMRSSLRNLALGRLGLIDGILLSQGFFRAGMAEEFNQQAEFTQQFGKASSAILIHSATAETAGGQSGSRASEIAVWGIDATFSELLRENEKAWQVPGDNEVVLTRPLADELGISNADIDSKSAQITIRLTRPSRLPGDSALGKKKDLTISLVRLSVVSIVDDSGLGGLTLSANQSGTRNAFVSLARMQQELDEPAVSAATGPKFANAVLIAQKTHSSSTAATSFDAVRKVLPITVADLGLDIRGVVLKYESEDGEKRVANYTSLSTSQMVFSDVTAEKIQRAFPDAKPVSTYLINSLRLKNGTKESGEKEVVIPYSMISAMDFEREFRLETIDAQPIAEPAPDEIVLNQWASAELNAGVGDIVVARFFEPESTHGDTVERSVELRVAAIARLTEPSKGFGRRGRDEIVPAVFSAPPTMANDPDLTPYVAGMTDSQSIENWDVPFVMTERVRPEDDDYWKLYRTTPKAFVSLETGTKLWASRFGTITGFRIPAATDFDTAKKKIVGLWQENEIDAGLVFVPLREQNLKASSGSTPFDGLFLGLSLFIIVSALMLVSLLFRLGLDERVRQIGTLAAIGFSPARITRLWLGESLILSTIGALIGTLLGVGWAALMVYGLTTWWVAAIGRPFLKFHADPVSIVLGAFLGIATAMLTVVLGIRRTSREQATRLLSGQTNDSLSSAIVSGRRVRWQTVSAVICFLIALGLAVAGQTLSGDNQAGAFMGSGFLVLIALLLTVHGWIRWSAGKSAGNLSDIAGLARSSLFRNPARSTLTVSLVAIATFLVVAINAFRLSPSDQSSGGVDYVARTAQPLFDNLDTQEGQKKLLGDSKQLLSETRVYSFRMKAGDDASCNNVFQSARPTILGISGSWVDRFDGSESISMRWAGSSAGSELEKNNPWHLLDGSIEHAAVESDLAADSPIVNAVIDKNTAWYSLKVYTVGSLLPVTFDSGQTVRFRVCGFLENSLLQGSVLIGDADFRRLFPEVSGYRYFLVDTGDSPTASEIENLESRLSDQGFDAQPATTLLTRFMSVQNTYLSAFQSLGGLGLLLGTFGLAAVMLRNIVRRQSELAVMRCVGFSPGRLAWMVLLEQGWLLGLGLLTGMMAALFSTLPHLIAGGASIPWSGIGLILAGVVLAGGMTGIVVARRVTRLPLVASLRGGQS